MTVTREQSPTVEGETVEAELRAVIDGDVLFDFLSRTLYSTDASLYQIMPLGVVVPKHTDDVVATVEICRRHGVPITARGGGTALAGQSVGPGVQVDFSKYLLSLIHI